MSKNFEFNLTRAAGNTANIQVPAPVLHHAFACAGKKRAGQRKDRPAKNVHADGQRSAQSPSPRHDAEDLHNRAERGQNLRDRPQASGGVEPRSVSALEDSKGKILAEDDDSGGNLDARIVYRAQQSGIYRLVATTIAPKGHPAGTGAFVLTVTEQDDGSAANPAPSRPPVINPRYGTQPNPALAAALKIEETKEVVLSSALQDASPVPAA